MRGSLGNSIVWLNGETIAIGDNPDPEREAGSRILVVYDVNSGNPRGQPLASDLAEFARVHEMDMPTILMGAHGITITPDKKTIAYSLNDSPINNGYMTVAQDVNGGQLSLSTNGVQPSYTADGEIILVSRWRLEVQRPPDQLFRVNVRTGASERITDLAGSWHRSPAFTLGPFTLGPVAENIASQTSKGTPTARPARSE